MGRPRKTPTPKPKNDTAAPDAPADRADGWFNAFTGVGMGSYDKRMNSGFLVEQITQDEAEAIWRGDDFAAKAVEKIPDEMLREGFCVKIEGDKDLSEEMDSLCRDFNAGQGLLEIARRALYYARAFGGSGVFLGSDDGATDLALPLNEDKVKTFPWVNVLTPNELSPVTFYRDPRAPKLGQVETYRLVPFNADPAASTKGQEAWPVIHESRILRIAGFQTTTRATMTNDVNPGWDDSVFVRTLRIINDAQATYQSMGILIQDFAPPILKMVGLARLLAGQNPAQASQSIQNRVAGIEKSKSNARAVLIDKDEEYKRETTNVAGLKDLIDATALRVASALDIPVELLMGEAPAGLAATGDSTIRFFYDRVASIRRHKLAPFLRHMVKLMFLAKDGPTGGVEPENWDIHFPPLWQMTDLEKSTARLNQANADMAYVNGGVLLPEEVAQSRFGGDEYSTDTQVDMELRQKARTAAEEQAQVASEHAAATAAAVDPKTGKPIPGKGPPPPPAPKATPEPFAAPAKKGK